MEYILTLNNIHEGDLDKVGHRALDIADLNRNHFKVPLSFVINGAALEKFVEENKIKEKGAALLSEGNFEALQQEFLNGAMPEEITSELKEAYSTLAVTESDSAAQMVGANDSPFVTVVVSPNYRLKTDDYSGIVQNIKGLDQLAETIKTVWASLFSSYAFTNRTAMEISEFFSGIMVQRMPKSIASASAVHALDKERIIVRTWKGFPEYGMGFEKDNFEISSESLQILQHQVRHQSSKLARDDEENLIKISLEGRGSNQKIDDKMIIELARLAKKMSTKFGQGTRSLFTVEKEDLYLLQVERLEGPTQEPVQEETVEEQPKELDVPAPLEEELEIPKPVEEETSEEVAEEPGLDIPSPLEEPVQQESDGLSIPTPLEGTDSESEDPGSSLMPEAEENFLDELGETNTNQVHDLTEGSGQDVWEPDASDVHEDVGSYDRQEGDSWEQSEEQGVVEDPEDGMSAELQQEVEKIDERISHIDELKDKVQELDELLEQGREEELKTKLHEIEEAIQRLKQ